MNKKLQKMAKLSSKKIGFIGTGNMACAICEGLIRTKTVSPANIFGSDVFEESRQRFLNIAQGIKVFSDNKELVKTCDLFILSIKPQQADAVLSELSSVANDKLIVSIMAGKTIDSIAKSLNQPLQKCKIVRVMPNTPLMVSAGASAIVGSIATSQEELQLVCEMFACSGQVAILQDEKLLDPVTALSGSSPAYVFALIEAMAASAEKMGIPKDISLQFAIQAVYGSGKLALERYPQTKPSQLREMVTSKGGTTEAALNHFHSKGFNEIVDKAMQAAVKRAEQLSKL